MIDHLAEIYPASRPFFAWMNDAGIFIILVLVLSGPALHYYQPYHRMAVEERLNKRHFSAVEAQRRIRQYRWYPPLVTLFGSALLGLVLWWDHYSPGG